MPSTSFEQELAHVERSIGNAKLQDFAVPHAIVDHVFSVDLIEKINRYWPGASVFKPEVSGNHIFPIYRNSYEKIDNLEQRAFWRDFNETLWPVILAASAKKFAPAAREVFGDLYDRHLSLDWPLTLMQADPSYIGHEMHTHFYHAPYWAFTLLLYVDPADTTSCGTGLDRVVQRTNEVDRHVRSYRFDHLDWRADIAMNHLLWNSKSESELFDERVSDYKASRLFMFMDGPLALHRVPKTRSERGNASARTGMQANSRRRILRAHVKVDEALFFARHSKGSMEALTAERYAQVLAHNKVLSPEDLQYRDNVLRPFYKERLQAYARAAEVAAVEGAASESLRHRFWQRLQKLLPFRQQRFLRQFKVRVP